MTEEQLDAIIEKHQESLAREVTLTDSQEAETRRYYLFGRLHRAFLGLDQMTPGRTSIYAETAAHQLQEAKKQIENGRNREAIELISEVANSLFALQDLENTMLESQSES